MAKDLTQGRIMPKMCIRDRTNIDGVYAAGDCTGRPYQYAKAVGEGNVAVPVSYTHLDVYKRQFINNYTAFENLKTLASIRRRIDDNRIRETLTEIGLDPDDKLSLIHI